MIDLPALRPARWHPLDGVASFASLLAAVLYLPMAALSIIFAFVCVYFVMSDMWSDALKALVYTVAPIGLLYCSTMATSHIDADQRKMSLRVLLDAVVALALFTFIASVVFVVNTHHLQMYRLPTIQWWQYVSYYGYRRDWDRWLRIGAVAGAVPATALLLRTVWDLWGKRFFFRLAEKAERSGE